MGFIQNKTGGQQTNTGGGFISRSQNSVEPQKDFLQKTGDVVNKIFPGKVVGQNIGVLTGLGLTKAKEVLGIVPKGTTGMYDTSAPSILQTLGDVASGASMVAGLKAPVPSSFLGSVGQYAGLSGAGGFGSSLAQGNSIGQSLKEGSIDATIGAATGGFFNLLGKGISSVAKKTAPSTLSFTSGVPKVAIEQTMQNPSVSKQGLNMSVPEIRKQAVNSLNSLYKDLGTEFSTGMQTIRKTVPDITKNVSTMDDLPNAVPELKSKLVNIGKNLARDYRISFAKGVIDFSKSNIVSPSEQKNVIETMKTLENWKDFSPRGAQDLAERIGALRKFESGATTKASAIVGKIYNSVAGESGVIGTLYPELRDLRANFSKNKEVLDAISDVLSADKTNPRSVQSAVSRLDNVFTQNKDTYINALRELSKRSGTDFLSLLAGGEFQKVLPGYIRGIGGAATVGVASYFNPFSILLAPLFSPRGVGAIIRNAPNVANTTSRILQSGSTQIIPKFNEKKNEKIPNPQLKEALNNVLGVKTASAAELPDVWIRNNQISQPDIEEATAILFGEISNRSSEKQILEAQTILNTAFNRMDEYRKNGIEKTLTEVLQTPNQYQAFKGKQYEKFKAGKLDELDQRKIDSISKVISQLYDGSFKNNIGNHVYYKHLSDGRIIASPGKLFK